MINPTLGIGLTLAACAPLLLTACGEAAGEAAGWEGSVRDSAGVQVVSNAGRGAWNAEDAWTVEPDLRIGATMGEPHFQFGMISGLDVGSDGRIYVMDQQASEVRIFDAEGSFITRMGRAGAGPGELSQAAGPVFVGPGGTVTVPDAMNQRLARFSGDGTTLGDHPLPMTAGIATRWVKTWDGHVIQQAMIMAMPGQEDVEPKNLLIRRHATGEITDTVMELPIGGTLTFGSGGQPTITLFESEPMWTVDRLGRLVSGDNSEYRLQVRGPDGTLERVVTRAGGRQLLTESDQEEFRRIIGAAWEQAGMPPEARMMMMSSLRFASTYPSYANLLGGPDGTLWVQSVQTPETVKAQGGTFDIQDTGGPAWDVFGADGRFLGVVNMPPRFTPMLFQDDAVYGIQRDEMDVQYVARMEIVRGSGR